MECNSAIRLVENLIFLPGWRLEVEDHTHRFEGAIRLNINYPARNTNRDQADGGYATEFNTAAAFVILAGDCNDDIDLYRKVMECILVVWEHECREALRVRGTNWAPFHPHHVDGMKRWGNPASDVGFGTA